MTSEQNAYQQQIDVLRRQLERERAARKQAEDILEIKAKELYETNEKLRHLLANSENELQVKLKEIDLIARFPNENPNPVLRFDLNGDMQYANTSAKKCISQLNTEEQNTVNRKFRIFIDSARKKGQIIHTEFNLTGKVYKCIFVPVANEKYINVYAVDITERIKARTEIDIREKRYRAFLSAVPDMLFRIDQDGNFLDFRPGKSWSLIPNISKEEILERTIWQTSMPENTVADIMEKIKEAIISDEIQTLEYKYQFEDEKTHYFEARMVKSGHNEATCVIRDVTDSQNWKNRLIKQKQFYESILNNLPSDIAVFDASHNYRYVNPVAIKDDDLRKWIIGKTDFDYVELKNKPVKIAEDRRAIFKRVIEQKEEVVLEEKLLNTNTDQINWHYRRMFPVLDKNREIDLVIGYGMDITDLKETQQKLEEARDVAEKSLISKERFLANMSHEIRTPMNAIVGMSRLLGKTDLDETQKTYLQSLKDSGDHLLVILNDILDISKIEAGKLELENRPFNFHKTIKGVFDTMRYKADEKDIAFRFDFDPKIAEWVIGDMVRLKQIVINILSNAIKFTEKGSVHMQVACLDDKPQFQEIQLSVKDTGIGIEKDKLDHVFELFSQEDGSINRKFGGTGLGLSISKQLTELMGGKLHVQSTKGFGTIFTITLSYEKSVKDWSNSKKKDNEHYSFTGLNILLAEDNKFNQLYAQSILQQNGMEVAIVENGRDALDKVQKFDFDLVLMDIQMPVMDGIQALKNIRKYVSKDLPVIALTANALKGDKEKFMAEGFSGYASKPFEEEDLLQVIALQLSLESTTKPVFPKKDNEKIAGKEKKLLNTQKLEKMAGGNDDFVKMMIKKFIEFTPPVLNELEVGLEKKDLKAIRTICHKLKSSYAMVTTADFTELLASTEALVDSGGSSETIMGNAKEILSRSELLFEEIKRQY